MQTKIPDSIMIWPMLPILRQISTCFPLFLMLLASCLGKSPSIKEPGQQFVRLRDIDPTILQEIRYASNQNFVGRKITGYEVAECWLQRPAALALKDAQIDAQAYGLKLKVYDCYRPQKAVDHFVSWAKDLEDEKMKSGYYPNVPKTELFDKGYIASHSSHSRGAAVDITLVKQSEDVSKTENQDIPACTEDVRTRPNENSLRMGTAYDCFDIRSHTAHSTLSQEARTNRLLLKSLLEKYGFQNYAKEWWHFRFVNELYPSTYFDFNVK